MKELAKRLVDGTGDGQFSGTERVQLFRDGTLPAFVGPCLNDLF